MNVETLRDLFVTELHRTYGVETRLVDELATLKQDVDTDALDDLGEDDARRTLREAIGDHLEETETQVGRLEEAFEALDRTPEPRATPALDGLVREKELFNNVVLNDEVRPVFYLKTSRQIEQLEIAAYEQLLDLGDCLDMRDRVLDPLRRNLEEEETTLRTLESLAESRDIRSLLDELAASSGRE